MDYPENLHTYIQSPSSQHALLGMQDPVSKRLF